MDEEKRIFKYFIDLDDFKVDKNIGNVIVMCNEKRILFYLLKIFEGLFEVKFMLLFFVNENLEIFCLEEFERGMYF